VIAHRNADIAGYFSYIASAILCKAVLRIGSGDLYAKPDLRLPNIIGDAHPIAMDMDDTLPMTTWSAPRVFHVEIAV
jgi:hypothetical protein